GCGMSVRRYRLRQVPHFTARRVVVLQDIVDGGKDVGEVRSRERHGLHAAEVERAVRPYQVERRLGEARRLFDASGGHAATRRDEQSPTSRGLQMEAIADAQPRQSPRVHRLRGPFLRVGRYGHHRDATLVELLELRLEFPELGLANRAVKAAI